MGLERNELVVRDGKGGKDRMTVLPGALKEALAPMPNIPEYGGVSIPGYGGGAQAATTSAQQQGRPAMRPTAGAAT